MHNLDEKIEHWKKRLLDLNKRNRLINFKETKRSNIIITSPAYDKLFDRLVHDEDSLSFPFPLKTTFDENGEEHNISIQAGDVETNKTLNEQQKTLKVLRSRAKTSIEEQGINTLYLTFGMIRWKEIENSDIIISAPILLVPVTLTVESINDPYILQIHEDEIVVNPSLAFKFENDFGITLPEFDSHEDELNKYFSIIRKIAKKNDWEVNSDVNLTLLSFLKINMYKDLEDNKDKMVSNPIVKALAGDYSEVVNVPSELNNYDHDKNIRSIDTYQVVDADSSQQDAILLSKKGISFVLQGPPGTGKSQTITNIIAEAISDGKKVLFVSEKMAALEVVKKRLTEAGLEDFCLTLHSHKANKKDILNQLSQTLYVKKIKLQEELIYKLSILEEKRNILNQYQDELHIRCLPLNTTIYEINGKLAKLVDTEDIIFAIDGVVNTDVNKLNKYKYLLGEFSKTVGKLSKDYSKNPWYGCNVPIVTHELRHDIDVNLKKLIPNMKTLIGLYETIINTIGAKCEFTKDNIKSIIEILDFSAKSPIIPEQWMVNDLSGLIKVSGEYLKLSNEYHEGIKKLTDRYFEEVLNINAQDIISLMEKEMVQVNLSLDNEIYKSNKDIVLKANFISKECKEINGLIKNSYELSEDVVDILGVKSPNDINDVIWLNNLVELVAKKAKPVEIWFNEKENENVTNLLISAKTEQIFLRKSLEKIKEKYNDSILNFGYNEYLKRFEQDYKETIKVIANYNKLDNILELKKSQLFEFVENQARKLSLYNKAILKAYESSKALAEKLDTKSIKTFKEFISLGVLLDAIYQNPKPTLAWFDDNKEVIINKVISDIKITHNQINELTEDILIKYSKSIFEIDYKSILGRFNIEYSNFFKAFKSSYWKDKKTIQIHSKELNNKLTDSEIVLLLNKISTIKEKEQWLIENKSMANEVLGGLYLDKYTDWDIVQKNRNNFRIIKNYFGSNGISNSLKQSLLANDISTLQEHYLIIKEVLDNKILLSVSEIISLNIDSIYVEEVIEKVQSIIEISVKIKEDCGIIHGYLLNEDDTLTLKALIETLGEIRNVSEKRHWFKLNKSNFENYFGANYIGEDTNWDDVYNSIEIIKKVIGMFDKNKLPEKLIQFLISCDNLIDIFGNFQKSVYCIVEANVTSRLNMLLNEKNNEKINIKSLTEIIQSITDAITMMQDKYEKFAELSKNHLEFETIMDDILILNRVQAIEGIIKRNTDGLQKVFQFMFEGITTNWEKIMSSLEYAKQFKDICKEYSLSENYICSVCSDVGLPKLAHEYSDKLLEAENIINIEFKWVSDLFDHGETLYKTSLHAVLDKLEKCLDSIWLLEEWIDFRSIRQQCREFGLSEYIEKVEQINMHPDIILNTFLKRFYRLWLDAILPQYPAVYTFRSRSHESIIKEFDDLDIMQLKIARIRILERLISRLPDTNIATSAVDEVGILRRELSKQRKIMPLRKLFKAIPNLLTALKPCLMMSPLSVSMFLQAGGYNFDTIIFDEASQVCTEDAIGAIMRGKQVIIAGDSKQLPPTSFFTTTFSDSDFDDETDEDDYYDIGAYDSILEEAVNAIPERTLKWHYRSRHEHLIAFSNAKIYNHELVTFPSNMDNSSDNGVEYIFVENGVYDRGGKKHNLNEAKRVAELVFEHIRKFPNRSLGVVTFSESQQQAVDNAIRQVRLKNGQYERFFIEDKEDAFFIKNLENVQGDERDTIIFSIGYAKDANGVMYMNFGPLSRNGGYRRLNVAITRAKYNVKLVGSIHPTDINIDKTNAEGVKMLRSYIEFAINGASVLQNELQFTNTIDVDSPFEEAVHDFLIKNGYNVTTQVGCSGYRIDMAVKHPTLNGIFVLGIECDGATYHSARTARERDRLRQTVLEDIGWTIYRIWSTDWIKDSKTEGTKLLEAVEKAILNYSSDRLTTGSKKDNQSEKNNIVLIEKTYTTDEQQDIETDIHNNNPYDFKYYEETDVYEFERIHDDIKYLSNVIIGILNKEGPIHFELLCKRIATLFGNQKATSKVRNSVEYVIKRNLNGSITKKGDFYWLNEINEVEVKIPLPNESGRNISYISTEEIAKAMHVIIGKSFGISKNDLYVVTARIFGFNRTGENITQAMERACAFLLECNRVKEVDGKIVI